MKIFRKIRRLIVSSGADNFDRRVLVLAMMLTILPFTITGQTAGSKTTLKKNNEPQRGMTPYADYHMHLLSPAGIALDAVLPLKAVDLPEDLAQLLRERAKAWNVGPELAKLYTEDSIIIESGDTWIRGREAVAARVATLFARPHRITPVAFRVEGSAGYIAGYFSRDTETGVRHFGHAHLSVRKSTGEDWQIAAETLTFPGLAERQPITADQLVAQLDDAGMQRGAVLSTAYWFGNESRQVTDEYTKVKAENDWVFAEVARFPKRLVAFCSFNPLKDYALEELNRCAKNPMVKGLKLHLGNSRVDLRQNARHVEKVRQVFRAANDKRLAVVIHLWMNPAYETEGGEHAKVFLNQILPAAPDITVQIAHMAGGGRSTEPALAVFADAIAASDPRTKNLYFDVATLTDGQSDEGLRKDAMRMRQIGLNRILYGTDTSPPNPPARQSWATFRARLPLTDEEFRKIATNVAPYMR
jgi:predicted TIM-barrel fold metal-dependent hydrolase